MEVTYTSINVQQHLLMFTPNIGTIFNAVPAALTANIVFDLGLLPLAIAILYSAIISTKIVPRNWRLLPINTFTNIFNIVIATKLLYAQVGTSQAVSDAAAFCNNYKIPTILQNIVNVVPILPRFAVLPTKVLGTDTIIDSTNILRGWAVTQVTNPTFAALAGDFTQWSDSNIYKGSLTTCNFNVSSNDVLAVATTTVVAPVTGDAQLPNVALTATTFSTALGAIQAITGVNANVAFTFEVLTTTQITPQYMFFILAFCPNFVGFRALMNTIGKSTVQYSILNFLTDAGFVRLFQLFQLFPNPSVVTFDTFESDKEKEKGNSTSLETKARSRASSPTREDTNGNGKPQFLRKKRLNLKFTKIRKTEASKVSGIRVDVQGKFNKNITSELSTKFKVLIEASSIQVERAANIMQIDSAELYDILKYAWINAKEVIDEDFGKVE